MKNIFTIALILGCLVLGFFQIKSCNTIKNQDNLIKESVDTLHHYKTTIANQGAYISTLQGDKNNLITLLSTRKDSASKIILDSLKKDNKIQSQVVVNTQANESYSHKVDTIYKKVDFQDSISTKWYTASIKVKNDTSHWHFKPIDELILTNKLKSNGFLKGNTLTTYAQSLNPDEDITGVTSISTEVEKPKLRIAPSFTVGINSDIHGKGIRGGFAVGIGITFK